MREWTNSQKLDKEGLKMKLVKRLTNPKEIPNFAAETKQVKRE